MKYNKTLKFSIGMVTAGSMIFTSILAASPSVSTTPKITLAPKTATPKAQDKINTLKDKAIGEIDRRLDSLSKLSSKISDLKKLTSDQKTSLKTEIDNEITNLNNLKTKIQADSDLTTLKTDVKSIVDSFRVFVVFEPKLHILSAVDIMDNAVTKLTDIYTKLQSRVQTAETQGKDVTNSQSALTDIQTKLTDAKVQYNNAQSMALTLEPSGYPANKTQINDIKSKLKAAKTDFEQVRKDISIILNELKGYSNPTKSTTVSPTATLNP